MKVTINVTKAEAQVLRAVWCKNTIGDHQSFTGFLAIKLARAIKKMEREK